MYMFLIYLAMSVNAAGSLINLIYFKDRLVAWSCALVGLLLLLLALTGSDAFVGWCNDARA